MEPQAIAERVRDAMYARDNVAQALGIVIDEVGPGRARGAMVVRRDMLNGHGTCHGGMTYTLADTVFAYACNSGNQTTVALACDISYLAPAREGERLVATAQRRSRGGRTGTYDIDVATAEGRAIALFRGTAYQVGGEIAPGPDPAP